VRNLVRLGANSRATVIEHYLGLGDGRCWTNSATDIALGDGARLSHYVIQRQSSEAYHTADIAARQGRDSSWHTLSISLGARLCRNDIHRLLAEPGAHCSMDGLYMADGARHVDHHTTIDHAAPRCTSQELYKGILGGRASGVFNGKVVVRNEGQKTDSAQLNKNLLLSDAATIDTGRCCARHAPTPRKHQSISKLA
jgi:Fe-S cluster assembly protein SufD